MTPAPSVSKEVGKPNGNNLALEPVDFSSRTKIIIHLPQRVGDLLFRPYPWQDYDWSQRLGAIGTLSHRAWSLSISRWYGLPSSSASMSRKSERNLVAT